MTRDECVSNWFLDNSFDGQIMNYISQTLRDVLTKINKKILMELNELRLRAGNPLIMHTSQGEWFVDISGTATRFTQKPYVVNQDDILKSLELMSENSIYAYQEEIKSGFITLKGGHRVGLSGRTVVENGDIRNLKDISGLCIRVSKEVKGCSDKILKYIIENGQVQNTMIISPPICGKTTLLRDVSRALSNGDKQNNVNCHKVCIVDERSEIAACYKGVPQNNVGIRTDVLDRCPKIIGMDMAIRALSPDVVITDEIGNKGDYEAICKIMNAGARIITSAHGFNISELKTKKEILQIIEEKLFDRFVVLSNRKGPGTLEEVIDGKDMKILYRRSN